MAEIPNDPMILLSYLNTKLRDVYPSLTDLCKSLGIEEEFILKKMQKTGYCYDGDSNRFM